MLRCRCREGEQRGSVIQDSRQTSIRPGPNFRVWLNCYKPEARQVCAVHGLLAPVQVDSLGLLEALLGEGA